VVNTPACGESMCECSQQTALLHNVVKLTALNREGVNHSWMLKLFVLSVKSRTKCRKKGYTFYTNCLRFKPDWICQFKLKPVFCLLDKKDQFKPGRDRNEIVWASLSPLATVCYTSLNDAWNPNLRPFWV
jgi:hypothetical protein